MQNSVYSFLIYIQIPLLLMMSYALFYDTCSKSGRPLRNQHNDLQKAFHTTGLRYAYQFVTNVIWTSKQFWNMRELESSCFEKNRWLVITNYFMIFAYGSAIMIVVFLIMICYCPVLINALQPVTEDLNHIPVSSTSHRNAINQRR
jgi:hypothetical protein